MARLSEARREGDRSPEPLGHVGQRIRAARLERGMSLAQVGGEDLSRSFLSLVELGRSRISLRALAIVAERLELPMSYFLDDAVRASENLAELVLDQAEAALSQRQPEQCLRLLDGTEQSNARRPRELLLRGRALVELARYHEAVPVLREVLAGAERAADSYQTAEVEYVLAQALSGAGLMDESLIHARRALEEAMRGPEDPMLLAKITVGIGNLLYERGDVDGAIDHYSRARDLFGSLADLHALGCVYSGLSLAYKRKGDVEAALHYSKLSLGSFQAQQNTRQAARELNNMAVHYVRLDQLDQGLQCAREAVSHAQKSGADDVEALARSTLASIYLEIGDVRQAEEEATLADRLAEGDSDLARIDAWIVLAKIAEQEKDFGRSDALYRRALDALEESGNRGRYADGALAYSLALQERGEIEAALRYALAAAQGGRRA